MKPGNKPLLAGSLRRSFVLCISVPVLLAEGSGSDTSVTRYSQQRSDTTVRVVAAPRNPGSATLVSEVSIGGASATADEYIFTRVTEVLPLRDGSIVVVDRGSGTSVFVRQYNAQGRFVRTLGRHGEGPGEYIAPNGLGELPDGRIIVFDGRGGRVSVYPPTGGGQGSQLIPATIDGSVDGGRYLVVSPDGTIHIARPSMGSRGPTSERFIRFRPDGSLIDTLVGPDLPTIGPARLEASAAGVSGGSNIPFSPASVSGLSPLGYFVTGRTDRYALDLRIPPARGAPPRTWVAGDPVTSLRIPSFTPVPVADGERAEARKRIEDRLRGVNPSWQWTGPDIPRVKPPFKFIEFGLDGRIWVSVSTASERLDSAVIAAQQAAGGGGGGGGAGVGNAAVAPRPAAPPVTWREPIRYDVFDPDGTYHGSLSVPNSTGIRVRRGDYAWGTVRDADGDVSVHRFRIVWR